MKSAEALKISRDDLSQKGKKILNFANMCSEGQNHSVINHNSARSTLNEKMQVRTT